MHSCHVSNYCSFQKRSVCTNLFALFGPTVLWPIMFLAGGKMLLRVAKVTGAMLSISSSAPLHVNFARESIDRTSLNFV